MITALHKRSIQCEVVAESWIGMEENIYKENSPRSYGITGYFLDTQSNSRMTYYTARDLSMCGVSVAVLSKIRSEMIVAST